MGRQNKQSRKRKVPDEEIGGDLGRFAGSSEEENSGSSDEDESHQSDNEEAQGRLPEESEEDKSGPRDDEMDGVEVEGDDPREEPSVVSGMAGAMSKILGTATRGGTASVIRSKTTTPLQRMAEQEKEQLKEQKEKRRENRERNLAALHIPLSVATTRQTADGSSSSSLVKELELERTHRRVATRGVVALFNAIAQHQKKSDVSNLCFREFCLHALLEYIVN